ncbi:MAG: CRTAC1 family protein, partial [Planctomycetota bacterium]
LSELHLMDARPFQAWETLQQGVQAVPSEPPLRRKLAAVQAALGFQRLTKEHLVWLVQRRHGTLNELMVLSDLSRPQSDAKICQTALRKHPEDLRPEFGLVLDDAYEGRWSKVAERLAKVVEQHPEFYAAMVLYSRSLIESGRVGDVPPEFYEPASESIGKLDSFHAWMAAGALADSRQEPKRKLAAYLNAVRANEDDTEALLRLAEALRELGYDEESAAAFQRAERLGKLRIAVDSLLSWQRNSQQAVIKIANHLEMLGRRWEAVNWLHEGFQMSNQLDSDLGPTYRELRTKLTGSTPWQNASQQVGRQLAAKLDVSADWASHWKGRSTEGTPSLDWQPDSADPSGDRGPFGIAFEDQADQRGLRHVCSIKKPPGQEADLWIYQSTVGGSAVLDYDLDGFPDVYLTASDGRPLEEDSAPNQLFRNRDGQFQNVTPEASTGDPGFAQGVGSYDFNADGFPDLVVGNLGSNRLYQNNGDGTFSEVSREKGLEGSSWTTSVAMADLNGDSLPDLYEVGYCAGDNPVYQPCLIPGEQEARSCMPIAFDGQSDRVWQTKESGAMKNVSADWLADQTPGRGLAITIGCLDEDDRLDVLVGNDMTANHFWSALESAPLPLTDQGIIRGLSLSRRSTPQASMGIAAGDPDHDGDFDFVLSHFTDDYNTFYQQEQPGTWSDRSDRLGIAAPTLPMLAFGTHWIDANNDGALELMFANGHVDDFTHAGTAYRMPAQLLFRKSSGTYALCDPKLLGNYFQSARLGRSVAMLDADQDSRSDLVVTHLFDPVALLINRSDSVGGQLRFRLVGTACERDAIGAKVIVTTDGLTQTGQVFAGDGFSTTHERCVTFGVGDATTANVKVRWPDGTEQGWQEVAASGDYLIVQGDDELFRLLPREE